MDLAAVRRWWPLAATLALLFVTALAATRSAPQLDQINPEETPTEPPLLPTRPTATTGAQQPPEVARGLPDWVGTAALIAIGVIGVVVVGIAVFVLLRDQARRRGRRAGRRTQHRGDQPRTADELVAALDAGLEELSDTDRDPRRAVIACWVRLEQAAAAAGTPRQAGDTSTDLVLRLLGEHRVSASALDGLAAVYRAARFGQHTVDESMRDLARAALRQLRGELEEEARAE